MDQPSNAQQRIDKIQNVLQAVDNNRWRSYNEFQLAFYTSDQPDVRARAEGSLRFWPNRSATFMPRVLLDALEKRCPSRDAKNEFQRAICEKAAQIFTRELARGTADPTLKLRLDDPRLADDRETFGLSALLPRYIKLMPNLYRLLIALLVTRNRYERITGRTKKQKEGQASRVAVVIISMILYALNRATNAFQLPFSHFLSSGGAATRLVSALNRMCIAVSYRTSQRSLESLTNTIVKNARGFVLKGKTIFFVPFDNVNFTHRKASERLDNRTEQINATTSVLVAMPAKYTHAAYDDALSVTAHSKLLGERRSFQLKELLPTDDQLAHWRLAMMHGVRTVLLASPLVCRMKHKRRVLQKPAKQLKPRIRVLEHSRTVCFPLPAMDQEEASVSGMIRVLTTIWTDILQLTKQSVAAFLRLLVGDWLSIRNIRLAQQERSDEWDAFENMQWAKSASMPFHFQLNAIYMLCRLHIGHEGDTDPASLSKHNSMLKRAKMDTKKPEYNKARQLVAQSLLARLLELTRKLAGLDDVSDLRDWQPTWAEFDKICASIVDDYASSEAADRAAAAGDDILQHGILFIRDALLFHEFSEAIRDADVGRMWAICHIWTFAFRGAGCTNYANEVLEMHAQYYHEMSPKLRELLERTWLVNRWGLKRRSIATDLFIEHINGFIKNMFAALGSKASIEDIQKRASATVEVLRKIAHGTTAWLGVRDPHRGKREVDKRTDLLALCSSLKTEGVYELRQRVVPVPKTARKGKATGKTPKRKLWQLPEARLSGVRDAIAIGIRFLDQDGAFEKWKTRTSAGDYEGEEGDHAFEGILDRNTGFDAPDGSLPFDAAEDPSIENVDLTMTENGSVV